MNTLKKVTFGVAISDDDCFVCYGSAFHSNQEVIDRAVADLDLTGRVPAHTLLVDVEIPVDQRVTGKVVGIDSPNTPYEEPEKPF